MNIDIFEDLINRNKHNKLSHAYLFESNDQERCLKDLLYFIKKINCPFEFRDECTENCNICRLIDNDSLPSLVKVYPNGQFIKKEQIIEVIDKFKTKPIYSKYNIYIINDAEKLNSSSANSLLKFLEEPEDNILGFFIASNNENVISTIRSRCQIIYNNYEVDSDFFINNEYIDEVKIYLNSIYKNKEDLLYNKTKLSQLYDDRKDYEKFFYTMFYYLLDCYKNKRNDKIDIVKNVDKRNLLFMVDLVENMIKYIKSNVNIDLILDKFVIEMRKFYE